MKSDTCYPLLFTPVYKEYLWGGARIGARYGRAGIPATCAESWEIADRPEGMSVARNGPWRGRTLRELADEHGADLVGTAARPGRFPLLVKLIDAHRRLSVQVHPDARAAAAWGGEAKTEMWYVLDARPDARVFAGLAPGVTRAEFEQAVAAGSVERLLTALPVRAGMAIFIPGGRVHAIGEGCLLLELQQNSDTTYRLYDWGRLDRDGRPRELHVEQALRCIDWDDRGAAGIAPRPAAERTGRNRREEILRCEHFRMESIDLFGPGTFGNNGRSFHALFVERGSVTVRGGGRAETVAAGTSCLLPAAVEHYSLAPVPESAPVRLLLMAIS